MYLTLTNTQIARIHPRRAIPGGRIMVQGAFQLDQPRLPEVRIGDAVARLVQASSHALLVHVPADISGGRHSVQVEGVLSETDFHLDIGAIIATGLHQVDNPVFDRDGNLYVTYSGTRGQQTPISIFRVRRDGSREALVSKITNPTSMAFDPDGQLHVSSRFDGTVYRVDSNGKFEAVATELGVACGIVFDDEGQLYVGDRSGTVFRVDASGTATTLASLPASVAAFHLAMSQDHWLYVTGPTLDPCDSVYRIDREGVIEEVCTQFGRPQGLTLDAQGVLYVIEALAGASGLYRVGEDGDRALVLAAPSLIGVTFDPDGNIIVASNDTVYRFDRNSHDLS